MNDVKLISQMLEGDFSNKEQYEQLSETEQITFPFATHKNHILNSKIMNLPTGFQGIYLFEESYYVLNGKEKFKSDVFLFELNESNQVVLSATVIPKEWLNKKYEEVSPVDYNELAISDKFTPLVYKKTEDKFSGNSTSQFTSKTQFILEQEISTENLIIKEEMYNGEKRIFGFDLPIVYKRIEQ
ncbi:hypothetical protein ACYSNW_04865 [Enterococcus sp. LJL99]